MIIKFNDETVRVERIKIQTEGANITISEPYAGRLTIRTVDGSLVVEPQASNAIVVSEQLIAVRKES